MYKFDVENIFLRLLENDSILIIMYVDQRISLSWNKN
jgi:hypothetical protein